MADEKRELNPIDEVTFSEGQAVEIIKDDDEKSVEEAGV